MICQDNLTADHNRLLVLVIVGLLTFARHHYHHRHLNGVESRPHSVVHVPGTLENFAGFAILCKTEATKQSCRPCLGLCHPLLVQHVSTSAAPRSAESIHLIQAPKQHPHKKDRGSFEPLSRAHPDPQPCILTGPLLFEAWRTLNIHL